MKTINYIIYSGHLGENTEEMNNAYIDAVQTQLEKDYPDADVTVELANGAGYRNGYASGFDDDEAIIEECNQTANEIWGRADYC